MITDLKKKKKRQGKRASVWDFRLIRKLQIHGIVESYRRRGLAFCAIQTMCTNTHNTHMHDKGNTANSKA